MALAFSRLDQPARALMEWNTVVRLAPQQWYPYERRGFELQEMKNYSKAIADYNRAIALEPDDQELY